MKILKLEEGEIGKITNLYITYSERELHILSILITLCYKRLFSKNSVRLEIYGNLGGMGGGGSDGGWRTELCILISICCVGSCGNGCCGCCVCGR